MTDHTPTVIASRYRILRELGRGGMGVVYLAEHLHTGDHVALKVLLGHDAKSVDSVQRFGREARASARIKSDHVVKVVDADVAPELLGAPFLVMELLTGTDLQELLRTRGRVPPNEALHYLTQAARGLDKAHALGIVHRDLKPGNLFLHRREDGSTILKVMDFGISKFLGETQTDDPSHVGVTHSGAVMGTPLYMAPEQARGQIGKIAPTTDVWSIGLIALQLLTGETYFSSSNVSDLLLEVLHEPLYPPTTRWRSLPAPIDTWFARSCARDPARRFARVGEQVQALGAALGLRSQKSIGPDPDTSVTSTTQRAVNLDGLLSEAFPSGSEPPAVRTTTGATARNGPTAGKEGRRLVPMAVGISMIAGVGALALAFGNRDHNLGSNAIFDATASPGPLPAAASTATPELPSPPAAQSPPSGAPPAAQPPAPPPSADAPPIREPPSPGAPIATVVLARDPHSPSAGPKASTHRPPLMHAPSAAPAQASPAPDCDPAYTIDPMTHHRLLKPECK